MLHYYMISYCNSIVSRGLVWPNVCPVHSDGWHEGPQRGQAVRSPLSLSLSLSLFLSLSLSLSLSSPASSDAAYP